MLKQQLQIKLSQKLSPQQIKLMKLIQMSTLDLEQKIEAEIGEGAADTCSGILHTLLR